MKIALAQLNPTIGDFEGNLFKIEETLKKTKRQAPDLVLFSELFLVGYPPRDLLEKKDFLQQSMNALSRLLDLSKKYKEPVILCGTVLSTEKKTGKGLYNSAVLIQNGKILFKQHKSLLPTYDVFDEARYFDPAPQIDIFQFKQEWLGITICEDAWNDPKLFPENRYTLDPVKHMAEMGATLFINISASPFTIGKEKIRHQLFRNHARTRRTPFLILNQVGGNDELIFDGRSMAFNQEGEIITILPPFTESLTVIDLDSPTDKEPYAPQEQIASVYHALVLGIRDYMDKCGFQKTVIGLSGGIDSALVSCLASDANGPENVLGVSMPSPFSSPASIKDAQQLAKNLGIQFKIIPITQDYRAYLKSLETHFSSTEEDVTEENIQARIRGNILMAMSNKFGYLTLSPGNKSELSVGYCTLYGDMSGGLGVLSDVPKTMVYQLSRYRNRENEVIPATIFNKPPSAELKPGQKDEDTLPPYEILDRILHLYLDRGYSKNEIIAENIDKTTVDWVIRAVDKNEFKRRQAAPGLKVTTKAFGTGRRMPIAAKYHE